MSNRKRQKRMQGNVITPDVAQAFHRYYEIDVSGCRAARGKAERQAMKSGDYTEYHKLLEPCGVSCLCAERRQCELTVWRALRWRPWFDMNPMAVNVNATREGYGPWSEAADMTQDQLERSVTLRRALLDAAGMVE